MAIDFITILIEVIALLGRTQLSKRKLASRRLQKGIDNHIDKLLKDFVGNDNKTLATNSFNPNNSLQISIFPKCYIELKGRDLKGKLNTTIDKYVEKWLLDEDSHRLAILGDYGIGKTTFCRKLAYTMAASYKNDPQNNPIPVLMSLKDHQSAVNIQNELVRLFKNSKEIETEDLIAFQKMLSNRNFVFILDSFDEMSDHSDILNILKNLNKIEELVFPNSKLILTCRTHFFKTQEYIKNALIGYPSSQNERFKIIFIDPLEEDQIQLFLKKYAEANWTEIFKFINNTWNLRDLANRPILLALIVKIYPELKNKGVEKINAGRLYQQFLQHWLEHGGKPHLGRIKIKFMEKLAMDFLLEGKKESIPHTELREAIKKYFSKDMDVQKEDYDHIEKEIRTASFLVCDEEGNYQFAHRSFLEFFLAQMLVDELKDKKPLLFKKYIYVPVEVYAFVNDLIPDFKDYFPLLSQWLKENCYPSASFIGQMGFKEFIPQLLDILSDENYQDETKYNAARALERLHNSSYQPYYRFILNWKESDLLPVCFRLNSVAMRGNKLKTPKPGFGPATYILEKYPTHPDADEWLNISDTLFKSLENSSQFVRINAAHALIRWLHPNHLARLISLISNLDNDPHVKGNLIFCLVKLDKEGLLGEKYTQLIQNDLSYATLRDLKLSRKYIPGINFEGSDLQGAQFNRTELKNANFKNADLRGANFNSAILVHAAFQEADLRGANLKDADINGANFDGSKR